MKAHFISIGGAVMHNLAIALHLRGDVISGSDDAIFEPSRSRLDAYGLLPDREGWDPMRITADIDAVILGMHARKDNPELIAAMELGLPVFSFPEFLYSQYRDKKRIVIAGSHGKTTITAMVLHVLQYHGLDPDYMVGARLEGFDVMVKITDKSRIAVLEGDEYLSSPLDPRPKFLHYHADIALISGMAWDHINVFPTEAEYREQFDLLVRSLGPDGTLVYCASDKRVQDCASGAPKGVRTIGYHPIPYMVKAGTSMAITPHGEMPLHIFGRHNMENLGGAMEVCRLLGVGELEFFEAISSFRGASGRLQRIAAKGRSFAFRDFAHAPSKLKATVDAVREQYPSQPLIACMELHTFSSLNRDYLLHYSHTMDAADVAAVFYHPDTLRLKRLPEISPSEVKKAFGREDLLVFCEREQLVAWLKGLYADDMVLLLMSSGDFHGLKVNEILKERGYDVQ